MNFCFICFSLLVVSACNFAPMMVNPTILTATSASQEGKGKIVRVAVNDVRSEKEILGYWGKPDSEEAPLTLEGGIRDKIHQAVVSGLRAKGFTDAEESANRLNVELRRLTYANSYENFWHIKLLVDTELYAVAESKGDTYQQAYIVHIEKRYFKRPSAKDNMKYIDAALSAVVNKLLNDQQLIGHLAR